MRSKRYQRGSFSHWSAAHLPAPSYGQDRSSEDVLPEFSALVTDEDRERKAELQEPGTYLVVVNPSSFASLPEYSEDDLSNPSRMIVPAGGGGSFYGGSTDDPSTTAKIKDPNIVIIKKFEDPLRRSPALPGPSTGLHSTTTASQTLGPLELRGQPLGFSTPDEPFLSRLDQARSGGRDAYLLQHYRSNISSRVIKVGSQHSNEDLFEVQARTFPPVRPFSCKGRNLVVTANRT